ncbi:hypothetical protein Ancab_032118, partial [Ancistrocladus abbreviatus]
MTKIDSLRCLLFPCFTSSPSTTTSSSAAKKRLSASLRDYPDQDHPKKTHHQTQDQELDSSSSSPSTATSDDRRSTASQISQIPSRPSKSMVISTFFGRRLSHVWFCVQLDRLSTKPSLLLELSLSTYNLLKEMRSGLVRVTLECDGTEIGSCPLHSVPVWTMYCNGRRVGFAVRRKPTEETRSLLKKMQSMTVGAGVIPSRSDSGEIMYMRANYEWVVGSADSESFHLINPDNCP